MKFVKYKHGEKDARNRWYYYCQNNCIPFITVSCKRKKARIEFDYITFQSEDCDNALKSCEAETRRITFEIFERYKNYSSRISACSWGNIEIDNIEIGLADSVAQEIYDYVSNVISGVVD